MKKIEFLLFCILFPILITIFPYFVFAQETQKSPAAYELPAKCGNNQIVSHFAYTLSYNEKHEQADWVAYILTRSRVSDKVVSRGNNFRPDPYIKTNSAELSDYKSLDNNGIHYDRGHLAPAGDMTWSAKAMDESFYMSNMSPQTSGFNRGVWKRLEEQLRNWALEYDTLLVATGPVLTDNLPSIGPNKVSIPEYYYKVIVRWNSTDTTGIGFILPNASSSAHLGTFAVSIDSVEKFTGIDFYPSIPDTIEEKIESTLCLPCWSISKSAGNGYQKEQTANEGNRRQNSVQCSAMTKAGTRCKRMTKSPNGKCYQHGGD